MWAVALIICRLKNMKTKPQNDEVTQLNIDIPKHLHRDMKVRAAMAGVTLKELAVMAFQAACDVSKPGKSQLVAVN